MVLICASSDTPQQELASPQQLPLESASATSA